MSNYIKHAMAEFRAAGFVDENGKYCDEMQEAICNHMLKLLEVFDEEGHSGSSAPYAINMFSTLAKFEPIVPLTGEDWEWTELDYGTDIKYQNKRCSRVFKDSNGKAYDSEGKVFWEWYTDSEGVKHKTHYTCSESRVYIEFPYTPKTEVVYRASGAE
jgi:hypothetical protein